MDDVPWTLQPGDRIRRSDLHDQFGGARRGGMEPSAKTPNVFLFTSPEVGQKFGYNFDGWHPDGTYRYTGEGQVGDQEMSHGNRATRDHLEDGRAIRLFEKDGDSVVYVGEFEVPDESHVLVDEAPDLKGDPRDVFVFRLRPVGDVFRGAAEAPDSAPSMAFEVPVEASNTERFVQQHPSAETVEAIRREALLVARYVEWLRVHRGATTIRHAIPTAAGRSMFTDLFVVESRELVEAKASSSREHIRVALGQILDYARYVDHDSLAVLVPQRPAQEMTSLLISHGVGCIWESSPGVFDSERPARFPL